MVSLNPNSLADLRLEPWFVPTQTLPAIVTLEKVAAARATLLAASNKIAWAGLRIVVIPTPRFNLLLEEWKVKSGVLTTGVIALLRSLRDLPGENPLRVSIDRLGGRQYYSPLIHEAFPESWSRPVCETPERCVYTLHGLGREITLCFEPRADGTHLNVALASMTAKYVREICMLQFNAYWQQKLPNLKPTAGYPLDAKRFFADIRPIIEREGIEPRAVWRIK